MVNTFKQFLIEEVITPSTKPNTLSLWHGGNLENEEENKKQAAGRFEYAPGLYLTTHYDTALKYSKGSRKLYMITISKGKNLEDSLISFADCEKFVKENITKKLHSIILDRLQGRIKDGFIKGYLFNNVLLNENAITKANSDKLRSFYIEQGIDYSIVNNAFGWGEVMIVLFNMKKIVEKRVIAPKDKIEIFDLPTEFN